MISSPTLAGIRLVLGLLFGMTFGVFIGVYVGVRWAINP